MTDPVAGLDPDPDPELDLDLVRFGPDGLVPAVVQQFDTREVLMLAWMDRDALQETVQTRRATYFSRSRGERWRKGDTSGHTQQVIRVSVDCDADTVLVEVDQTGVACHTGTRTCFDGRVVAHPVTP